MLEDRLGMNFREVPWQVQNRIDYPGSLVNTYFKSIAYITERPDTEGIAKRAFGAG